MPRIALTDRFAAGAKPDGNARTSYFDSTVKGLELLVSGKSKTWYAHFVAPNGKRARARLGTYPATTLAAARTKALEARGSVEAGNDPRDAPAASTATVAGLIASYLAKYVQPNLRSAGIMRKRFAADVLPAIGTVKLADLHRRDINSVLDPIVARGSLTQARLVFTDIRGMLNWAIKRGDLDGNPMTGMSSPSQMVPRERVLSDDEIESLWSGLPVSLAKSRACQRIIKLCLVTGQRVGEIAGMRLDEIDMKARTWQLPGSRTKNAHPHTVPLSSLAISIIEEAMADAEGSPFIFPNLTAHAIARMIGRAQEISEARPQGRFEIAHWAAHDLRRTALTGMAKLGVAPIVIAHVANHQSVAKAGVTFAHYVRHGYEREMRDALDLWTDRLAGIVAGGAAVIPMRARHG